MYNKAGGVREHSPPGKFEFSEPQKRYFWPSGTDVCNITDAVTTKLRGIFLVTPLYTPYVLAGPPLLKPYFLACPPQTHQPPYLIKNERSLKKMNTTVGNVEEGI